MLQLRGSVFTSECARRADKLRVELVEALFGAVTDFLPKLPRHQPTETWRASGLRPADVLSFMAPPQRRAADSRGLFITTKPAPSRYSTTRSAAIAAMYSSAL